MDRLIKFLVNLGLITFLILTSVLVIIYVGFLWDKMTRPDFMNINGEQVKYLGLVALVFTVLDILIVRRFIKLVNKKQNPHRGNDR